MNAPLPRLPYGQHLLLDLEGIDPALLRDAARLEALLDAAARHAGATPIGAHFHRFGEGAGITGVVLLRESHISIHTWPEHGFAALDLYMCGATRPDAAADHIITALAPGRAHRQTLTRGGEHRPESVQQEI